MWQYGKEKNSEESEKSRHIESRMEGLGLPAPDLTEQELEVVTTVFRNYETGLREATIYPKVRRPVAESENKCGSVLT